MKMTNPDPWPDDLPGWLRALFRLPFGWRPTQAGDEPPF
jgi:hypothetical protein